MILTWAQLLNLVLKDSGVLGVGQQAQAEDMNDSIMRLNMMLGLWNRNRWSVYHLVDVSCVCDGSLFYEVGPTEALNVVRPDRIEAAFVRQTVQSVPNRVDYPLQLIQSYEEYSRIALKNLQAGPAFALFYDSGFPTGKAYPYPLMNSQFELHILVKAVLDEVVDVQDEINLPPEYFEVIYTNMCVATTEAYMLPPRPVMVGRARGSLATLKSANFQVGQLQMPGAVLPTGGAGYNIWSDRWGR